MKRKLKIRKLLCLLCLLLIFVVSNSFIYEKIYVEPEITEIYQQQMNFSDEETFTIDDVMEYDSSEVEKINEEVQIDIHSFHKEDWNLILINKQHPLPEEYEFTLETIKGSMKCDKRIIPELQLMMQDAKSQGYNLVIRSPYRDYERQIYLFERKIKGYVKKKISYLEAYRMSAQSVTVPGASEHQVGLALDITSDTYTTLTEGFADTKEGKWLAEHSYEYGFILRYPKGKEDITGITFEPWHFRYVGKSAAKYIYENELTLEEFVNQLNME